MSSDLMEVLKRLGKGQPQNPNPPPPPKPGQGAKL